MRKRAHTHSVSPADAIKESILLPTSGPAAQSEDTKYSGHLNDNTWLKKNESVIAGIIVLIIIIAGCILWNVLGK